MTTTDVPEAATRPAGAAARARRIDPLLGAVLHWVPAPDAAADPDRPAGPLRGMRIGVKANIATVDGPASGQSRVYDEAWWAGRDAPAVRRLRAAGAVVVAKTTMTEHALSRPDPDDGFPVPRNPWDTDRWTGGSSSGCASGVAAGLFDAALGTDCNGSIRIPAAMCGVTGVKPTFGLVPADGCRPLSRSTDTVGPLARDVRTCAALLGALTGEPLPRWRTDLRGVRVGVPREVVAMAGTSDGAQAAFDAALADLTACGATVVDVPVSAPDAFGLFAAQVLTVLAEAFEVHGADLRERWEMFGRPFRRGVVLGGLVRAESYLRAQRVRAQGARQMRAHLAGVDVVATPSWPAGAPRLDDADGMQATSFLPSLWSAVGFPAVALPMGFDGDGLPVSLQLAGPPHGDAVLAAIADVYQQRTGWHRRTPPEPAPGERAEPLAPPSAGFPADESFAAALHGIGIVVDDAERADLGAAWARISMLAEMLPPVPVGVPPIGAAPR